MKLFLASLLLALTCLPALAQAQKIYRCGNSYSQVPCPGGSTVEADDSRTAAQRKQHETSVQNERRTADAMEKDRLKQEAAAARAAQQAEKAASAKPAAQKPASVQKKHPPSKDKLPAYAAPRTAGAKKPD